jgi:hypothetical protein
LAWHLKPRRPFVSKPSLIDIDILTEKANNLQGLDHVIKEVDPLNSKMPVLLRKYLELGGRIASFNVDPLFNNTVDGFLILELNKVKPEMIKALGRTQVPEQLVEL